MNSCLLSSFKVLFIPLFLKFYEHVFVFLLIILLLSLELLFIIYNSPLVLLHRVFLLPLKLFSRTYFLRFVIFGGLNFLLVKSFLGLFHRFLVSLFCICNLDLVLFVSFVLLLWLYLLRCCSLSIWLWRSLLRLLLELRGFLLEVD